MSPEWQPLIEFSLFVQGVILIFASIGFSIFAEWFLKKINKLFRIEKNEHEQP